MPTIQVHGMVTLPVWDCVLYAAAAYTKGDLVRVTGTTSGPDIANAINTVIKGDESNHPCDWWGVVLETTAAAGLLKVRLRGRCEAFVGVGSDGSATAITAGVPRPLIHAADIDDITPLNGDKALTAAADIVLDGTVSATTGYGNFRKVLAYSLGANDGSAQAAALMSVEFDGVNGFGMVQGAVDLT